MSYKFQGKKYKTLTGFYRAIQKTIKSINEDIQDVATSKGDKKVKNAVINKIKKQKDALNAMLKDSKKKIDNIKSKVKIRQVMH